MKRLNLFLFILCVMFFLIFGTWLVLKSIRDPEVITIYHSTPSPLDSVSRTQTEHTDISKVDIVPKTESFEQSEKNDDDISLLFAEEGFSPEEELEFWDWLAAQESGLHGSEQVAVDKEKVTAVPFHLASQLARYNYPELYQLVMDSWELKDILSIYEIEFFHGRAICPFCGEHSFSTHMQVSDNGRESRWFCNNCSDGISNEVVSFVAKMEGFSHYEATLFLMKQLSTIK